MSRQWRCAVVGMGAIGEWHTRVIQGLPNATLVAACDQSPERGKATLAKCAADVPCYPSLEAMVAREKLDVVHICTPSGNHLEPSLIAMQAGVNVICEKPLEITLERIDRMIEAAGRHKVRIAGIFQNRWNAANRAIKDAIEQGRFGRVAWAGCFTPWFRTDEYYRSGGWRGTWALDGGGAMMNQSVHAVDLLQWMAGPVRQVSAYAGRRIHQEIEVEDTLTCSLQFESGAFGTIMGSTAMFPGDHVRIQIGGEHGSAVSEDGLRMFKFRDEKPADRELVDKINRERPDAGGASSQFLASLNLHIANTAAIYAAWDADREPETNAVEARKAIALILAMYESARRDGAPVAVGSM